MVLSFTNQIKENIKMNDKLNFSLNNNSMNFNSIIIFRIYFDKIIEPKNNIFNDKIFKCINRSCNKNNDDIFYKENNIGFFEYNKYNKMKSCLDQIINNQNNINNNFISNSNNIMKILWENYSINKNNNNLIYLNKKKSIIEKYIDLSKYNGIIKSNNNLVITKSKEKESIDPPEPSPNPSLLGLFIYLLL